MANGRSLTRAELDALQDGTGIVVTLAGRESARQTVVGELRRAWSQSGPEALLLYCGGVKVATLNPGDGFDEDFVVLAEGGKR